MGWRGRGEKRELLLPRGPLPFHRSSDAAASVSLPRGARSLSLFFCSARLPAPCEHTRYRVSARSRRHRCTPSVFCRFLLLHTSRSASAAKRRRRGAPPAKRAAWLPRRFCFLSAVAAAIGSRPAAQGVVRVICDAVPFVCSCGSLTSAAGGGKKRRPRRAPRTIPRRLIDRDKLGLENQRRAARNEAARAGVTISHRTWDTEGPFLADARSLQAFIPSDYDHTASEGKTKRLVPLERRIKLSSVDQTASVVHVDAVTGLGLARAGLGLERGLNLELGDVLCCCFSGRAAGAAG